VVTALALQLIAIAPATVLAPAAGSTRPDMTVFVRGTRIEAAGPSRSVMVVSGPYLVRQPVPLPHRLVCTPDEAVAGVDSLARLHVDFIKVHNGMPPAAYFAVDA
jgi:hypothetical protein